MDISPSSRPRVVTGPASKLTLSALILVASFFAMPSWAAFVTTNEMGMNLIFGGAGGPNEAVFGPNTVEIRFNPTINHVDGSLLNIDSGGKFSAIASLYQGLYPSPIVRMFFVDAINWCGSSGAFAGCAAEPGTAIVIDSDFADNSYGAVLNAHELGHNLGLPHASGSTNLMNGTVTSTSHVNLLASQVAVILASPLIQLDGIQRYISITPILVSATAIATPIPGALILCFSGLVSLGVFRRKLTT